MMRGRSNVPVCIVGTGPRRSQADAEIKDTIDALFAWVGNQEGQHDTAGGISAGDLKGNE